MAVVEEVAYMMVVHIPLVVVVRGMGMVDVVVDNMAMDRFSYSDEHRWVGKLQVVQVDRYIQVVQGDPCILEDREVPYIRVVLVVLGIQEVPSYLEDLAWVGA